MKAEELRRIGKQAEELAKTMPSFADPQEQRVQWANTAEAFSEFIAGVNLGELPTIEERQEFREARREASGWGAVRDGYGSNHCVSGLTRIARLMPILADRVPVERKSTVEMLGETLREAGLLAAVFGFLDGIRATSRWTVGIVLGGVVLLAVGWKLERNRKH